MQMSGQHDLNCLWGINLLTKLHFHSLSRRHCSICWQQNFPCRSNALALTPYSCITTNKFSWNYYISFRACAPAVLRHWHMLAHNVHINNYEASLWLSFQPRISQSQPLLPSWLTSPSMIKDNSHHSKSLFLLDHELRDYGNQTVHIYIPYMRIFDHMIQNPDKF